MAEQIGTPNTEIHCPVCGYYCLGKGGVGCIDKPGLCISSAPPVDLAALRRELEGKIRALSVQRWEDADTPNPSEDDIMRTELDCRDVLAAIAAVFAPHGSRYLPRATEKP